MKWDDKLGCVVHEEINWWVFPVSHTSAREHIALLKKHLKISKTKLSKIHNSALAEYVEKNASLKQHFSPVTPEDMG